MRSTFALTVALACGCSFSSYSGGGNQTLGGEDEGTEVGDTRPGASGTRGVADGGGEEEGGRETDPSTSGPSIPPGDDDDGRLDLGSGPVTGGDDDPLDCSQPSTFELRIEDAQVVPPMTQEDVPGVGLAAYSTVSGDGEVVFTVDIVCPGTYYLRGYVADGWAGVHPYGDPDSFEVWWPGGGTSWFYGCQTYELGEGWYWLPVHGGELGSDCVDATPVELVLEAGSHTITLQNREPITWDGYVAAIARLVVTDDPDFSPP